MNIILLGQPGSGKGTQGRLIAEKFGFHYLSTGELFREMSGKNPDVAKVLGSGRLLDDEFVLATAEEYLERQNIFDHFVLDGTPRSVNQYEMLKSWLLKKGKKIDLAIFLKISDEETIRRQSARRTDKLTGKIYNLITNPPGPEVKPDKLEQRDDDKPEAIKVRLVKYHSITEPLVEVLKKDGILVEVDGQRPIDEIFSEITKIIEGRLNA
jgi:adenylate kinase